MPSLVEFLDAIRVGEVVEPFFDLREDLGGAGIAENQAPTVTASVWKRSGVSDANPSAILSGAPWVQGASVYQSVAGLKPFVNYSLVARVQTTEIPPRVLVACSVIVAVPA